MRQLVTTGIILNRTDYGEADRIITLLTPDQGKLRLMAKGVRKIKSKLAGGIELFSVSDITYIQGRREIGTLISARLIRHFDDIAKVLDRTMLGYELIRRLDKATEDEPEAEYFELLEQAFVALDDRSLDLELIRLWFAMQLLCLGGHTPDLQTDTTGQRLQADKTYQFSVDDMAFTVMPSVPVSSSEPSGTPGTHQAVGQGRQGQFTADHIKFLRLGFAGHQPATLANVQGVLGLVSDIGPLVRLMAQTYVT